MGLVGLATLATVAGLGYWYFVAWFERELDLDFGRSAYAGVMIDSDGRIIAVVPECFPAVTGVAIDTSDGRRLWEARGSWDADVRQITLGTPPPGWGESIPLALPLSPGTSFSLTLGSDFFSAAAVAFSLEDLEAGSVYSGSGRRISLAEFMKSECSND